MTVDASETIDLGGENAESVSEGCTGVGSRESDRDEEI
jgi:hypothetical protein